MPGIPQPKVDPRAASVSYNENQAIDTSAGLERTFERLGQIGEQGINKLGELHDREKHKANVLAVSNTLTALQGAGNDALYGRLNDDGTRTPGYFDTKGLAAQKTGADAFSSLKDRVAGAVEATTSPEQKEMLQQHAAQLLEHWDTQIHEHAFQQQQAANVDGVNAAKAMAIETAVKNPNDDKAIQAAVARVVGAQDALVTSPQNAFAEADKVEGEVTSARLDSLLNQPGGWQKADELFQKKKVLLGLRADDFERRINQGKLAAVGAVEASRIVAAAVPSVAAQRYFRMPDEGVVEAELGKLAQKDPKLFEIAAPIARAQLAFQKNDTKERKDAFVDQAQAVYNRNHATFFSSDIADRLNHVDPTLYRTLWKETYHRAKAAGDESSSARGDQEALIRDALDDFQKLPADQQVTTDLSPSGKFAQAHPALGRAVDGVSDGLKRIEVKQRVAQDLVNKGLGESHGTFISDAGADIDGFLPPATTLEQRRQHEAAVRQAKAKATEAYANFVQHAKRAPTPDEALDLRAGLVKGKVPLNDAGAELAGRAAVIPVIGGAKPPRKVEVVDDQGNRAMASESGLDAWLAAHPKWKKRL